MLHSIVLEKVNSKWSKIEYDGIVYHSSDEAKARDARKDVFCKEKGIPLIEIPYSDYDKIDTEYIRRVMNL